MDPNHMTSKLTMRFKVLNTAHIRRRRKRYLFAVSLLLFAIALFTGFAADLGVAALARMPEVNSIYLAEERLGPPDQRLQ